MFTKIQKYLHISKKNSNFVMLLINNSNNCQPVGHE